MTIYKGCPYCTAVFAIGPQEDEPLRRHIAHEHTTTPELVVVAESVPPDDTVDDLRVRLAAGDRRTRDLTLALLAQQGVTVEALAEWFGLHPGVVRARLDAVDRAVTTRDRGPRTGERRRDPPVEDHDDGRELHRLREPTAEQ